MTIRINRRKTLAKVRKIVADAEAAGQMTEEFKRASDFVLTALENLVRPTSPEYPHAVEKITKLLNAFEKARPRR